MDRKKPSSSSTGKMKFVPKAPKRRPPPTAPSQPARNASAADKDDEDAEFELLPSRFRRPQRPRQDANEKKSSVRVSFGGPTESPAPTTTTTITAAATSTSQPGIVIRESSETMILHKTMDDSTSDEETYEEPWDYDGTYYPTTLPLRRPHSGYPGTLDEDEFGQAASNKVFDEKNVNVAEKLGLLDGSKQKSMILFQFPKPLPISKDSAPSSSSGDPIGQSSDMGKVAEGHMGKLLVYKSGAVKLKLGEVLFHVSPGTGNPCEQAVVMNINKKDCCLLGQIEKSAVVSLDVDSVLDGSTEK